MCVYSLHWTSKMYHRTDDWKNISWKPIRKILAIHLQNTDIKIQWGTNICLNLLEIMLN